MATPKLILCKFLLKDNFIYLIHYYTINENLISDALCLLLHKMEYLKLIGSKKAIFEQVVKYLL
jgi:hypothetical protein